MYELQSSWVICHVVVGRSSFAEKFLADAGIHLNAVEPDGRDLESSTAPQWSGYAGEGSGVLQGWLRKKSPAAGLGWQTRWFVLHGIGLSYYKKKCDSEATGIIDLSLIAACFTTTEVKHGGRGIKLIMLDQRTYYLLASTRADAQVWVNAISAAVHPIGVIDAGVSESIGGEINSDTDAEDTEDAASRDVEGVCLDGVASAAAGMDHLLGTEAALLAEADTLEKANAKLRAEVRELEAGVHGLV
jgi:hypothetical protein